MEINLGLILLLEYQNFNGFTLKSASTSGVQSFPDHLSGALPLDTIGRFCLPNPPIASRLRHSAYNWPFGPSHPVLIIQFTHWIQVHH